MAPRAPADDASDLLRTLAHHDAEITTLAEQVKGVQSDLHDIKSDMSRGFASIGAQLSKLEGSKGPGLGQIVGVVASGGAVVAMIAAAITVLVSSQLSPDITKLKTEASRTEKALELREHQERQELTELRKARDDNHAADIRAIGKSLRALEARMGWANGTEINKPGK